MEWGIMTIVGPVLLVLVLAWAMLNNRRSAAENGARRRPREFAAPKRKQPRRRAIPTIPTR